MLCSVTIYSKFFLISENKPTGVLYNILELVIVLNTKYHLNDSLTCSLLTYLLFKRIAGAIQC